MNASDFQTLLYDVHDGVATVTLNRPDKLNAFTAQMRDELIAAFDLTDADDAVRAVVVTGAGRAFCARRRPRRRWQHLRLRQAPGPATRGHHGRGRVP